MPNYDKSKFILKHSLVQFGILVTRKRRSLISFQLNVKFIEKLARQCQAINNIEGDLKVAMVKPQITVRLSRSLLTELNQYVKNTGTSKTDVVVSAIAQYIGCNKSVRINQRVAELETQMKELKTLVKSSSSERKVKE